MPLKSGNKVAIWEIEDKGGYAVASLSTSKKDKDGRFVGDWKNKFCWLVDKAYENFKDYKLSGQECIEARLGWGYDRTNNQGQKYKQSPFEVSNNWDKAKSKEYTNYKIYDLEPIESNKRDSNTDEEPAYVPVQSTNPFVPTIEPKIEESEQPTSSNGLVGLDFLNIPDSDMSQLPFK